MQNYLFQNEPVDVGLGVIGPLNLVGPLTFTAVFLPASQEHDILLRYDLFFNNHNGFGKESIADIGRYNRLLSLNRSELGYLIKVVGPEEASNLFQGEGDSD
jgi:hypothetical protein